MIILDKDLIKLNVKAENYQDVIKILGQELTKKEYVKETYVDAVLTRELASPTGLPSKGVCVAIPHTESKHVNKSCIGVATLIDSVEFSMMGDTNKKLDVGIVLLLAIKDSNLQLLLLQKLMTIFQNEDLLISIKNAKTDIEVTELLQFLESN